MMGSPNKKKEKGKRNLDEKELKELLGAAIYGKFTGLQKDEKITYLQKLCDGDIFGASTEQVREYIENMNKEETIAKHPYAISQWQDGKWRTYLPDENAPNGRRLVKRTTEKAIKQVVYDFWKEEEENPTLEEVFNEWNDRRLQLKQIAPGSYDRNKQVYNRHYKKFGKRRIRSISPEDVEDFLEEQIPKYNLTAKAFSGLKTITKGMLKRAKKRKLIDFSVEELFYDLDTSEASFKKSKKKDEEEVFTEEETDIMLRYLIQNPDARNLGILIMFLTGLRVGELVALKFSDIEGNAIRVQRTESRFKRDGKDVYEIKESPKTDAGDRVAVIPEDYMWVMKKLKMQNPFAEYIFFDKGKRMTTNVMRRRLEKNCKRLGLPVRSPHKIRKTYASIMFENHIDTKMIIKMMGHTDISCTENHYHRNRKNTDQMTAVVNQIADFKVKAL